MDWLANFQLSLEAADANTLATLLADEVALHTPAVIRQSYTGKALVAQTLGMALSVLAPIQVTDALRHEAQHSAAVVFTAQIVDGPLQGIWHLTDHAGGLAHFPPERDPPLPHRV